MSSDRTNIVILAGGIGGAKIAEGLSLLHNIDLSVIGNIGDDDIFHGLKVSPDIDTLTYTLAGLVNRSQGWGLQGDDYKALSTLEALGDDCWMLLGDRDLGLHIYRTYRLGQGDRPSEIAKDIALAMKIKAKIILPSDDEVRTKLKVQEGWLSFQEYFVKNKCEPKVYDIKYEGADNAVLTDEVTTSLRKADILVFAPSNPLLSIAPILEIKGMRDIIFSLGIPRIAISPLIGGKAVKGPTTKIMESMAMRPDSVGIAQFYQGLIEMLVIDHTDENLKTEIEELGIKVDCRSILMDNQEDKKRLSLETIQLATGLSGRGINHE